MREAGQAAQFGRNRAREPVVAEPQVFQVRQFAELGRQPARQPVVPEPQFDYAPLVVHLDSAPLLERRVGEPVPRVDPVAPARRVVEHLEDLPVRGRRALRLGAPHHGDGLQPRPEHLVRRGAQLRASVFQFAQRQIDQRARQPPGQRVVADTQRRHRRQVAQTRR